jgi:hypothetical protein
MAERSLSRTAAGHDARHAGQPRRVRRDSRADRPEPSASGPGSPTRRADAIFHRRQAAKKEAGGPPGQGPWPHEPARTPLQATPHSPISKGTSCSLKSTPCKRQPTSFAGLLGFCEERIPAFRETPGFKGVYLLADRRSGKVVTISLWDSEDDLRQNNQARGAQVREEASSELGRLLR